MPINLNYASITTYFIEFYQTTNLKATMRTLRKLGLHLFITIIASLSFASCSDDDDKDNNGGNKASATIGGESLPLSYAYWYFDENTYGDKAGNKNMIIEFYSVDITKMSASNFPSSINSLSIDYDVPSSQNELLPTTVDSRDYHLYLAQNVTLDDEGWQGETKWRATSNSPVVIKKEGNTFTITISSAEIYGDNNQMKELKFSYTGPISYLPEKYQD